MKIAAAATIAAAGQLGGGEGWSLGNMAMVQCYPQPISGQKRVLITTSLLPGMGQAPEGGYKLACGVGCHVFKSKFCHLLPCVTVSRALISLLQAPSV